MYLCDTAGQFLQFFVSFESMSMFRTLHWSESSLKKKKVLFWKKKGTPLDSKMPFTMQKKQLILSIFLSKSIATLSTLD